MSEKVDHLAMHRELVSKILKDNKGMSYRDAQKMASGMSSNLKEKSLIQPKRKYVRKVPSSEPEPVIQKRKYRKRNTTPIPDVEISDKPTEVKQYEPVRISQEGRRLIRTHMTPFVQEKRYVF